MPAFAGRATGSPTGRAPRPECRQPTPQHPGKGKAGDPESDTREDGDDVEHGRRQGRQPEALLGVEHSHGHRREGDEEQERHHDPCQQRRDFDLSLVGREAGRENSDDPVCAEDSRDDEPAKHDGEKGEESARQPMGRLPALSLQHSRVGRDERGGERTLCEEIAKQVGNAERSLEGVGVKPRA